jgi:hypothetical protein
MDHISFTRTAELHLSGLNGMVSHPDMQKIWIIGFFFENMLHWQFEVRLLLFTVYLCLNLSTTHDLKLYRHRNIVLYLTQLPVISS